MSRNSNEACEGEQERRVAKMELKGPLALIAFLASYISVAIGKLSPEECRKLGFSSNLLCGSCNDLKQFKLDILVENCRSCCEKDQAENEGKVK